MNYEIEKVPFFCLFSLQINFRAEKCLNKKLFVCDDAENVERIESREEILIKITMRVHEFDDGVVFCANHKTGE